MCVHVMKNERYERESHRHIYFLKNNKKKKVGGYRECVCVCVTDKGRDEREFRTGTLILIHFYKKEKRRGRRVTHRHVYFSALFL